MYNIQISKLNKKFLQIIVVGIFVVTTSGNAIASKAPEWTTVAPTQSSKMPARIPGTQTKSNRSMTVHSEACKVPGGDWASSGCTSNQYSSGGAPAGATQYIGNGTCQLTTSCDSGNGYLPNVVTYPQQGDAPSFNNCGGTLSSNPC